jgi:hypothetical protein
MVADAEVVFVQKDFGLVASREAAVQFPDQLGAKSIDPLTAVCVSIADEDVEIVLREKWHFGAKTG